MVSGMGACLIKGDNAERFKKYQEDFKRVSSEAQLEFHQLKMNYLKQKKAFDLAQKNNKTSLFKDRKDLPDEPHYYDILKSKMSDSHLGMPFETFVRPHYQKQFNEANLEDHSLTASESRAIDALARTIYGEVRGCLKPFEQDPPENKNKQVASAPKKGALDTGYAKAVAKVTTNRARLIKQVGTVPSGESWLSHSYEPRGKRTEDVTVDVVAQPWQYSSLNPGDSNLDEVLCPNTNTEHWQESLKIAYAAIKKPREFVKETRDITETRYTSKIKPPWDDGTGRVDFTLHLKTDHQQFLSKQYGFDKENKNLLLTREQACLELFVLHNKSISQKISDLDRKLIEQKSTGSRKDKRE